MNTNSRILDLVKLASRIGHILIRLTETTLNIDQATQILSQFCSSVLKKVYTFSSRKDFDREQIETLKLSSKVFKISLPSYLESIVTDAQVKPGVDNPDRSGSFTVPSDTYKTTPSESSVVDKSTPGKRNSQVTDNQKSSADLSLKQIGELSIEDMWHHFQSSFDRSEAVSSHLKMEPESLTNTLINFMMAYNDDDFNDMMIFCEDHCGKIIDCVEFWTQRKLSKANVVFLLKLLGSIIKTAQSPLEKVKLQNMMINLSLVRILIKLFTQEQESDIAFLYEIVGLLSLLLEGGNRVKST